MIVSYCFTVLFLMPSLLGLAASRTSSGLNNSWRPKRLASPLNLLLHQNPVEFSENFWARQGPRISEQCLCRTKGAMTDSTVACHMRNSMFPWKPTWIRDASTMQSWITYGIWTHILGDTSPWTVGNPQTYLFWGFAWDFRVLFSHLKPTTAELPWRPPSPGHGPSLWASACSRTPKLFSTGREWSRDWKRTGIGQPKWSQNPRWSNSALCEMGVKHGKTIGCFIGTKHNKTTTTNSLQPRLHWPTTQAVSHIGPEIQSSLIRMSPL